MKIKSLHFKFLITIISAMLAVTVFIGGLCIYEVDNFVQKETEELINVTLDKDTAQINDVFGNMENSVHIMESYVKGLLHDNTDIRDRAIQNEIISQADEMFVDVAKYTEGAVAYYLRFAPEISDEKTGFFYSRARGEKNFIRFEATDLSIYDRYDTEHVGWYWQPRDAGKPVWMLPYHNLNNDIMMISYVVPLYHSKEFIGVVGIDFDYTVLTEKVNNIKIYENGFAHLEYEGKDVNTSHRAAEKRFHEHPEKYLSVSKNLKNRMTLVISASVNDIRSIRYNIEFKIVCISIILALLFSLLTGFIVRKIVYPLKKLTEASLKLSEGEYDVEIPHSDTHEIKLLSMAFENMTNHLKEHERLQHLLAYRDSLTGLRNTNSYKAWMTDFDNEIKTCKPVFGVMVLDINYLKETNDRYGHDVGNKLIVAAAQIISGIFKRSPVFRIGGDEFLVILQNRDLVDYETLLAKIDAECANGSIGVEDTIIPVSIARGFARFNPDTDSSFVDVFNRADDAMYENKRLIKGLI